MLELFMTFFQDDVTQSSLRDSSPHLRFEEFDAADSFICSLELESEDQPDVLMH